MFLQVFDVEHGACALLTADNGARLMIDCGHNATTGWVPGTALRSAGVTTLEMLAVTNYDEDHVSGIGNLLDNVQVHHILRNMSVAPNLIRYLKTEDGMGPGIERLVLALEQSFTNTAEFSQQPVFAGLERRVFYNDFPAFSDENNLSVVLFLKCHGIGVMFPGDLERAGWLALLRNPLFQSALRETNVLVASHHGRENGCCSEVFEYCRPFYVVISDKGYMFDTQLTTPFYRQRSIGGPFRKEETRHVLTTRNDGSITFRFEPGSWGPY